MKKLLPVAAAVLMMALVATGCGDDGDGKGKGATPTAAPPDTPTTGVATATETVVPTPTGTPPDETTPTPTTDPPEFENADGITGGQLYDQFWAEETGFDQNDPNIDIFSASGDFFRCKQCHAWDRLGNAASYINRGPKTTRPNVTAVNLAEHVLEESPSELFEAIKEGHGAPRRDVDADLSTYDPENPATTVVGDQMPDYGQILTDGQIWDLVKYLKQEAFDTTALYEIMTEGSYPTGSTTFSDWGRDGDAETGDALYATKCAGCHGADGASGPFQIEDGEVTVGSHVRDKPNETWHKVKFGQLGSPMGPQGIDTVEEMNDLYSALADPQMYPDPAQ